MAEICNMDVVNNGSDLRDGRSTLNSHMHGKLKLAHSPTYPYGQEKNNNNKNSMVCKDAPFIKLQEKMRGRSTLPWWPSSTAASRSWRRRLHSSPERPWSCRCERQEEEKARCNKMVPRSQSSFFPPFLPPFLFVFLSLTLSLSVCLSLCLSVSLCLSLSLSLSVSLSLPPPPVSPYPPFHLPPPSLCPPLLTSSSPSPLSPVFSSFHPTTLSSPPPPPTPSTLFILWYTASSCILSAPDGWAGNCQTDEKGKSHSRRGRDGYWFWEWRRGTVSPAPRSSSMTREWGNKGRCRQPSCVCARCACRVCSVLSGSTVGHWE